MAVSAKTINILYIHHEKPSNLLWRWHLFVLEFRHVPRSLTTSTITRECHLNGSCCGHCQKKGLKVTVRKNGVRVLDVCCLISALTKARVRLTQIADLRARSDGTC